MSATDTTNLTIDPKELPYWILLAHLPRPWTTNDINHLLVDILLNKKISLESFCHLSGQQKQEVFALSERQVKTFEERMSKGLEYFEKCVYDLDTLGVKMVSLSSPLYSKTLKTNLKMTASPPMLYCKGNLRLLSNPSVAIVGSRNASEEALEFTKKISHSISRAGKVVVSGFAKGVDKQSLDSSLEAEGQSIIVLPQGMLTFKSGLKKYSKQIEKGDVLVVSTYEPNAGWTAGLAMGRNRYIYGLASEIIVAQTSDSGGTWNGAIDGLKKKRLVKIYYSETIDSAALRELVAKGAIPINIDFNPVNLPPSNGEQMALF